MKYIYVVTRIMSEVKKGVVEIPNLGVHTNYQKAIRHYNSVVSDRTGTKINFIPTLKELGFMINPKDRMVTLATFYDNKRHEQVRLERWQVKK